MKGSPGNAKTYALKLLGYRSRSKKEMLERLKLKGFSSGQIEDAMEFLDNAGLINDSALASDLLRYSLEIKPLGKKGLRMLLTRRGIEKDVIDRTLAGHTEDLEEKSAREFMARKMKTLKNYPRDAVRRRLWGMLQRRGFSIDVINRLLNGQW